ncbi:helix-turn-helix domain-containing protein [Neobacillus cucumis]|uniref:helix-turn-helix domain-containing protein n=1 Tax=Neobacillus cucumis TaxID=1740721 RepID=UPI001964E7DA|nr:helix-turn-helix transcriptional regulator [Neobacillus cucumis]MBM7652527.1 transcriptional regulator with XRE-family HTH domain [Neobacillus cucumis]
MGKDKEKTIYIGKVVKRLRKEKGWSQEKVALNSNLDRSYYGEIERNEKAPSLYVTFKLARGFEIEPEDLVREIKESTAFYDVFKDDDDDK